MFILFCGCKPSKDNNLVMENGNDKEKIENDEEEIEDHETKRKKARIKILYFSSFYMPLKRFNIWNMDDVELIFTGFSHDELSEYFDELRIGPSITDIKFLENFPKLKRLEIDFENMIDNIDVFKYLHNLESLIFHDIKSHIDLTPISNLINLKYLLLSNATQYDLNNLTVLTQLQKLVIIESAFHDITPLIKLPVLEELNINYDSSIDYTILIESNSLGKIWFDYSQDSHYWEFFENKRHIFQERGIFIGPFDER
jgi:hypothetical protein